MSASQAIANSSELEDASYSWVTETDTPKSVDDKAGQTTSQTEETAGKQAGSTEKTTSDASEKKNTTDAVSVPENENSASTDSESKARSKRSLDDIDGLSSADLEKAGMSADQISVLRSYATVLRAADTGERDANISEDLQGYTSADNHGSGVYQGKDGKWYKVVYEDGQDKVYTLADITASKNSGITSEIVQKDIVIVHCSRR